MASRTRVACDLDRALDAHARSVAGTFLTSAVIDVLLTLAPDHVAELDGGAVADAPELGFREPLQKRDVVR